MTDENDEPDLYDKILANDEETAGVVVPKSDFDDYDSARIDVDLLESMLALVREMEWDEVWVSAQDETAPVFIEPAPEHQRGALVVAPILPEDSPLEDGDDGGD